MMSSFSRRADKPGTPEAPRRAPYRFVVAVLIVLAATAARLLFLQALGSRYSFVTLFPAVALAALYGGLWPGLLAGTLSALAADYFWIGPPARFGSNDPSDWLGLAAFLLSCVMISVITERMRAYRDKLEERVAERTASLQGSEARLQVTLKSIGDAVLAADPQGRVSFLNPVAEALTGWPEAEALGRPAQEVFRIINEVSRRPCEDIVARVLREGRAVALANHTALLSRDGREIPIEDSAAPILTAAGDLAGAVLVFHDVTAKRRADEALRHEHALLHAVMDGARNSHLVYLDRDFNFVRVNEAYAATCGYRPEEMVGKNHFALYPHAENEAIFARVRDTGEAFEVHDKPFEFPDQPERGVTYWDWTLTPVKDPAGRVEGLVFSLHETTARKRAEEALRQLNATLEQRVEERTAELRRSADKLRALAAELSSAEQRERKRLASILHDHIQQLLVAAKMQLELVKRADKKTIQSTAQGIESIITEAIDASRSLTVELSPPVLHQSGLAAALAWLAECLQAKNLFRVHLRAKQADDPASEPVRTLLFESVRELLLNAVKHSGVREAHVTMARTPDGWTQVAVNDQGAGFDADASKSRDGGGFGMFSIQQRLGYIGGRMEVESAPGRGTLVTLWAPPDPSPGRTEAPAAAPAEDGRTAPPPGRKGGKVSILLVDDHQIVRQGLLRILQLEPDMEVSGEAANGAEAVELARKLKPDVVVMDVNMPVMGGVEATRVIKRELPEVSVIGLSMHIEQGAAAAMRDAGATGYLSKGGPSEELIAAIRACAAKA